jgi:hypothetical protein
LPLALKIRWFCLVEKYYLLGKDVRVFIDDLIFPEIASVNAIRKSFYCQEVCHFTTLTFPYYQFFFNLIKKQTASKPEYFSIDKFTFSSHVIHM